MKRLSPLTSHVLFLIFLFLILFTSFNSQSQDFKKQFKKAKEQFNEGSYAAAMDSFNPLSIYDKENPYAEYASFYYALSAQRLGFATVARAQFAQLKRSNPTWPQIQEVNFWLAKLYMEHGDYFVAMQVAKEISDSVLIQKLDTVKRINFSKIDDLETVKMLNEENSNDREIERALAKLIARYDLQGLDSGLFNDLMIKNNWELREFVTFSESTSVLKDRYRVAVLFPFKVSTLEPSPERKKNQPILDLYQGMKLAVDSLSKSGVQIDLLAYDTEHDPEVTRQLLTQEELKSVDLLIGPLFADDAKPVQLFAKQNQINLIVNPVSNNSDFLKDNPYSFLYQPSDETIGLRAAELVNNKISNKNTLVYYSDSPKDSVMAFNFMKRAFELGLKVVYAEEVRAETSVKILDRLAKPTKYDEWKKPSEFTMKLDSIGSIFVASENPVIYTKVINSVESRGDSIVIIGQESWLEDNSIEYTKFENTKVAFASPNYNPLSKSGPSVFRMEYIKKHSALPSDNAKMGYELMMNLGRAMGKYGNYYQDQLMKAGVMEGVLTPGYLLQPLRDNGLVPFVSFVSGELVEIK